jgi:hypothetical protein
MKINLTKKEDPSSDIKWLIREKKLLTLGHQSQQTKKVIQIGIPLNQTDKNMLGNL